MKNNTQSVTEWFKHISKKSTHSFITFDIVDFYPSISEDLLRQAITSPKRRKESFFGQRVPCFSTTAIHMVEDVEITF